MKAVRVVDKRGVRSFRTKLQLAMMLVVFGLTSLGLFLAQRKVAFRNENLLFRKYVLY